MNNQSLTISVITICFNNLAELLITCESVDKQTQLPYEHWIIDGSSNDEISNYLNHQPQPSYRKWISERDKGIGDAFNKGVQRAGGNIINMLNSADHYFSNEVLAEVVNIFKQHPAIDWMHGKYQLQRGGLWVTIGKPFEKEKLYRGMRSLSHQSMFIRKSLHDRFGYYDITLRNAMDYDFVCRIAKQPFFFTEKTLVVFAPGGATDQHYLRGMKEARKVYEKYFGFSLPLIIWQSRLKMLYYLLKSPAGGLLYQLKVWLKLENA